jgi:ketosteroid isomerase-like protein
VSKENVELVLGLPTLEPGVDAAQVLRDADLWAQWAQAVAPFIHEDFEGAFTNLLGGGETFKGLDEMRAAWLDWLTPWESYRIELEQGLDCGDRVVTFYDVFASPAGSTREVKLSGADVWTVRDGKIARWEAYPSRRAALKAVGLEP